MTTATAAKKGKEEDCIIDIRRRAELDMIAMMDEPDFTYTDKGDLIEKCMIFILGNANAVTRENAMDKKEFMERTKDLANDILDRDNHKHGGVKLK